MIDFLFGLLVGALIGWYLPQPNFVKRAVARVRAWINSGGNR